MRSDRMKKVAASWLRKAAVALAAAGLMVSAVPVSAATVSSKSTGTPLQQVLYQTYVQSFGWLPVKKDSEISGTMGMSKRVEAFRVIPGDSDPDATITYQAYVQNMGWQAPVSNGQIAGTMGKKLRIQAIRVTVSSMRYQNIMYRVYLQNRGWCDWVSTTEDMPITKATIAGNTKDPLRIEAIQICI